MIEQSDVEEYILLICVRNARKLHRETNQCKNRINKKKVTCSF